MRTTVELPAELMRAAKVSAAERGESLKELFTRAVRNELGRAGQRRAAPWPLLRTRHRQKKRLTNADLEEILAADDIAKVTGGR